MKMESFITFSKGNQKQSYYVYNDCKAKDEKGNPVKDFTDLYIILTNLGWECTAANIAAPEKETQTITLPLPRISRKGEFVREFRNYLFSDENVSNLELS